MGRCVCLAFCQVCQNCCSKSGTLIHIASLQMNGMDVNATPHHHLVPLIPGRGNTVDWFILLVAIVLVQKLSLFVPNNTRGNEGKSGLPISPTSHDLFNFFDCWIGQGLTFHCSADTRGGRECSLALPHTASFQSYCCWVVGRFISH